MKTVELKLVNQPKQNYTDVTEVYIPPFGGLFGCVKGEGYKLTFQLKDIEYLYETEVPDREYEHLIVFEGGTSHNLRIESEGSPLNWGSSLLSANEIISAFIALAWSGKTVKLYYGNELWLDSTSKVLPTTGRIEDNCKLYFNGTHSEAEKVRNVLNNLLFHSQGKATLETQ
jgi:hypothetical protein